MNDEKHNSPTQPLPLYQDSVEEDAMEPLGMHEDEIVTPAPLAPPPAKTLAEPQRPRSSKGPWIVAIVALVVGLASLALNAFLIYSLLSTRQTAADGLDAAIAALDNFGGKGFHYDYRFQQEIPVSADIPIQQDLVFPFAGDFPINTTIEVPIDAGALGKFVIPVPINTSIYVETSVPIHVDQTFSISTSIPVDMTIPIDVQPDDPEIQKLLAQVRAWLIELRSSFY